MNQNWEKPFDPEEEAKWRAEWVNMIREYLHNDKNIFIPGFRIVIDEEIKEAVNGIKRLLQWYDNGEKPPQEEVKNDQSAR